jgi:hypothetical protein
VLTRICQGKPFLATWVHSANSHPIYLRCILKIFYHLRIGLQNGLSLLVLPVEMLYAFRLSSMCTICRAHPIFFLFITLIMKMAVLWVVTPCSLVEVYRHFRALMVEEASTSETLVNFYQTTRRNNPEGSHLCTRRRVNLKSHLLYIWRRAQIMKHVHLAFISSLKLGSYRKLSTIEERRQDQSYLFRREDYRNKGHT